VWRKPNVIQLFEKGNNKAFFTSPKMYVSFYSDEPMTVKLKVTFYSQGEMKPVEEEEKEKVETVVRFFTNKKLKKKKSKEKEKEIEDKLKIINAFKKRRNTRMFGLDKKRSIFVGEDKMDSEEEDSEDEKDIEEKVQKKYLKFKGSMVNDTSLTGNQEELAKRPYLRSLLVSCVVNWEKMTDLELETSKKREQLKNESIQLRRFKVDKHRLMRVIRRHFNDVFSEKELIDHISFESIKLIALFLCLSAIWRQFQVKIIFLPFLAKKENAGRVLPQGQ
jgi:hypothetical protein